ncbi:TPR-like protein [Mollisia scopiformis]|uniref:TPR-like protein n=1 Tax=Mollisia scopiformis TaxID=149040 RepID=A0A194X8J2_MOLSC|nr:TPR-like protein [Mollisia scopiformis]KUJ16429.1 TPR-like protein [Mollisia scopiformis]
MDLDLTSNHFPPEEAAAFLRQRLSSFVDTPEYIRTSVLPAERFGRLPLAMTQITALIDRWEMTVQEFLAHYEKQMPIESVVKAKPDFMQDYYYKHSLFTVCAFESLGLESNVLLKIMSFLNPDRIQESLFTDELPKDPIPKFPVDESTYLKARTDLIKVSLVKPMKEDKQIMLHRLVQDVVQAHMSSSDAYVVFPFTTTLLLRAWPTPFLQFEHNMATWQRSEELLQHILKISYAYQKYTSWDVSPTTHRHVAQLLLFAGWYLFERSEFFAAQPLLLQALTICRKYVEEMQDLLADNLFLLSALSVQINDNLEKNLQYAEDHFQVRIKLCDGSQFSEDRLATAHGELGQVLMLVGRYEESIEHCKIAIEITKRSPRFIGGDDLPIRSHCHQAYAMSALGRNDEAIKSLEGTLKYCNEHRESEVGDFTLGIVYRCLSYLQLQQSRPLEATTAAQLALRHFTGTVGKNSRYTSQVCGNLGAYHCNRSQYDTAQIYLEQALSGFKAHEWYGAELARTYFRLSVLHKLEGDDTGSSNHLAQAIRLYSKEGPSYEDGKILSAEDFDRIIALPHR